MESVKGLINDAHKLDWLDGENIRPYVFMRKENQVASPGEAFDSDWFPFEPLVVDALKMDEVILANAILNLENKLFSQSGMEMPRWVFYDCAIMPGLGGSNFISES